MSFSFLNRKLLLLIAILLVVIILAAIYLIDNKNQSPTLAGYEAFKKSIQSVKKNEDIANNRSFRSFFDNIAQLENQKLTKEQQKNQLISAGGDLFDAYASTNNHELYKLTIELNKFEKTNFPDFNINVQCLDSACAEQPIPKEILTIIKEINNSTVSAEFKTPVIKELTNYSYMSDSNKELKAINYLSLADYVRLDPMFIEAGINMKIYNAIRTYVSRYSSETWSKYSNFDFITQEK